MGNNSEEKNNDYLSWLLGHKSQSQPNPLTVIWKPRNSRATVGRRVIDILTWGDPEISHRVGSEKLREPKRNSSPKMEEQGYSNSGGMMWTLTIAGFCPGLMHSPQNFKLFLDSCRHNLLLFISPTLDAPAVAENKGELIMATICSDPWQKAVIIRHIVHILLRTA